MPGIPEGEIGRIKRHTDLAALVRSRGIELRKHDGGQGQLIGRCPFHAEGEASFIVTPAKGLFHCTGCGAAGNAIQFVGKFDGVSLRHAFELLNDGPAAFRAPPGGHIRQNTVRRLETPLSLDADDTELFGQVVDYYHERLPVTPAALEYLESRGVHDAEAIKRFRIGFADRTLGLRLPEKNRKDGAAIRSRLQELGLIRESGHEHFNGSIVLPVLDAEGRVAAMYGRKITAKLRKGTPLHLYLPGPHAGIWNHEGCFPEPGSGTGEQGTGHEVVLCDAPLDALTFWVNGIRNVTFFHGTGGFPDCLLDALLEHRVRAIRLAYRADEAGNRAAARDAERLTARGIECFRVRFPWGMDANGYAQHQASVALREGLAAPAVKTLRVAVDAAEWMRGTLDMPAFRAAAQASFHESEAASEDPAASPAIPVPQRETPTLTRQGEYHVLALGSREYRVGGLEQNNSLEVLKVSVRLRHEERFHLDSIDMTRDGDRRRFIERAVEETGLEKELVKRDLGKLLLAIEEEQDVRLRAGLEPVHGRQAADLAPAEREEALAFLKSPDLIAKIGTAFETCGLVGEKTNRLAAYLACTSRKLDRPLAVIIQSTSAAGKSTLMETTLSMFPEEERAKFSAMTGQSLYYLGKCDLQHRILAIAEEDGVRKAGYALKLLQSEGELTIASTGKDPHTGRMVTQEYHVQGPVTIIMTTAATEIDDELFSRCLVLAADETQGQTALIHARQRRERTIEGLRGKNERARLLAMLRNAQRLLKPVEIVNPWADQLTFANEHIHSRRDHEKYLTLIDVIAFLHQYQRPLYHLAEDAAKNQEHPPYILASLEDIALANRLSVELLGRSFGDLPPQTRRVYDTIKEIVRKQVESNATGQAAILFSRREIRDHLGWGITQIRLHLERLREMDLIALRGGRPGSRFQYELLADCRAPDPLNPIGLTDVRKLQPRQHPPLSDASLPPTCRGPGNECNTMNKKGLQSTCRDAALVHAVEPCIPAGGTSYT